MRGFYWTANSAIVRGTWFRVRRASKTFGRLNPEIALIPNPDRPNWPDSNPAHMIFECVTNTDWGMGGAPSGQDVASFNAAAQTLFDETFGLSLLWLRQDEIENFVSDILDHIQALYFLNPQTGLMTLKLLRGDYDVDSLPQFNPDNSTVSNIQRKTWGETVNEIVVTWTNPENEQAETVTIQDLSNIVTQNGQIVSQPRNYSGIRHGGLAARVAGRDLRTASAPLLTCDLYVDRSGWNLLPGSVLKLASPEDSITSAIMRVMDVDYGRKGDGRVKASLVEDIFALELAEYGSSAATEWENTAQEPSDVEHVKLITLPAYLIARYDIQAPIEYPEVFCGVLGASDNRDMLSFDLYTNETLATGDVVVSNTGTMNRVGHAFLSDAIPAEAITLIETFDTPRGPAPVLAGLVFIGDGDETESEIAMVQAVSADGYTLLRGVLDTTPRAWPGDTPMWFLRLDHDILDDAIRSESETVEYRLAMRTSLGLRKLADCDPVSFTATARPHLPLRPANVEIDGTGYGTAALGVGPYAVTWANRNRMTETSQILGWESGNVTPEIGQTTTVEVLDGAGAVHFTASGLTGTSYSLAAASVDPLTSGSIRVSSQRDGLDSLQSHVIPFTR